MVCEYLLLLLPLIRAGTGMYKQVRVEYRVSHKFQLQFGMGLVENTCITGEGIHRHIGAACILFDNLQSNL